MKTLMAVLISVAISTYLAYTLMKVHNKKYHTNKKPCSCQTNGGDTILPVGPSEPVNGDSKGDEEPILVGEIVDNLQG
jgi:hypothetical protein